MTKKEQTFTQALKRLEQIVEKLEDPNLELEEALSLLEEGVQLHKFCQAKLTQANTKITQILNGDSKNKIDQESEETTI